MSNIIKSTTVFLFLLLTVINCTAETGHKAPDFKGTTLEGREITYESQLKGKKSVYLIFWASW